MKIGILGGTGDLGKGLAQRLALRHEVLIGSREEARAESLAASYLDEIKRILGQAARIDGLVNEDVIKKSDAIIIALPYEIMEQFLLRTASIFSKSQLVISPIVPMEKGEAGFLYKPYIMDGKEISAAEVVAKSIPKAGNISSAFQTVPAARLADLKYKLDFDVLVASDTAEGWAKTASIISDIEGLKPYYAGRLYLSKYLEPLTPLMLNVAINNKLRQPSLKVIAERK